MAWPLIATIASSLIGKGVQPDNGPNATQAGGNAGAVMAIGNAFSGKAASPAPTTASTPAPVTTPTGNEISSKRLSGVDGHFYGHMTIEKCYQMSGTKGSLRSDKSSFAKSTGNGLSVSRISGKKGK